MLVTSTAKTPNQENTLNLISKGSVGGLWRICFPLMLSALSGTLMIFFARIILAQYDTRAMIAATTASSIFTVFQFGAMSIAMIAEVFVGQFNGATRWEEISRPVWQMIWFSLGCFFIMAPIGIWGSHWFIPAELAQEGGAYFKWMMIFGPIFALVSALSSFFIGRGKVKIVTLSVIVGNLLNLVFVLAFVFGINGLIQPMGAKGAAIATGLAELIVAIGLFSIFLNPYNRKKYHTFNWQFDKNIFIQCIKIALPNTFGHMVALAAWATMMLLLADKGSEHMTVMSIGLSIWSLFSFITEGLQKGVTAVAANCIGARNNKSVSEVMKSGLKLQFTLALVFSLPLIVMPELLVQFFIPAQLESTPEGMRLQELLNTSCRWLWVAFLFDGMAWVIDGILTAAGDTRFIMVMNSIGTWLFCIVPIYLLVVKMDGSPIMMLQVITGFCFILFLSYFLRYRSKIWQKTPLISITFQTVKQH
ncbi:MAG: MATE family efflux transporter [Candidatus Berkiellales bacterium]